MFKTYQLFGIDFTVINTLVNKLEIGDMITDIKRTI